MARLSAAEIERNKGMQRELVEAGYPVAIDGVLGPETKAAYEKLKTEQREKARLQSEQAKADADRQRAEADAKARAAEAEAEAARSRTAETKARADEARRRDEAAEAARERVFDTAVKTGSIAAGFAASFAIAKGVEKKVEKSIAAKAPELEKVAQQVQGLLGKANPNTAAGQKAIQRLGAIVQSADNLGLTKVKRGPAGLILASGLVVEGAVSRAFSLDLDNKTLQTLGVSIGAASIAAGVGVGAKDLYARSIPQKLPNAEAISRIEQARALSSTPEQTATKEPAKVREAATAERSTQRELSKRGRGATGPSVTDLRKVAGQHGITNASRMTKAELVSALEKAPGGAGRAALARIGARALLPAFVGIAAANAYSDAAEAGESTAKATAAAGEAGVVTAADIVTGGAISAYNEARTKGLDKASSVVAAVLQGAGNIVSFGAGSIIAEIVGSAPTKEYVPESVAKARAKREAEEASSLKSLAAQQAQQRTTQADVARENTAAFLAGQAVAGKSAAPVETIMDRVAEGSGARDFFEGKNAPIEMAARHEFMALAAEHSRTNATRERQQPVDRPPVVVPVTTKRASKGWTDEARAAALKARRAKGST